MRLRMGDPVINHVILSHALLNHVMIYTRLSPVTLVNARALVLVLALVLALLHLAHLVHLGLLDKQARVARVDLRQPLYLMGGMRAALMY